MPIQQNLRTKLGYCTEVDIENFLLTDINSSFSDQVDNWIVEAEDYVNEYLGYTTASGIWLERIKEEVNQSAKVDSGMNLVIYPRKRPVTAIEKIELIKGTLSLSLILTNGTRTDVDGATVTNYRYQLTPRGDKIIYPQREISTDGGTLVIGGFHQLRGADFFSRITYTAGYTNIPGPINLATTMLVADTILRQENKNGLQVLTQGRITKEWVPRKGGESDLLLDANKKLDPYRITSKWLF